LAALRRLSAQDRARDTGGRVRSSPLGHVAAGRRSDGMALFARLITLPASSAPMRRLYLATSAAKTAASRCSTRSPVTKWLRADDNQRDYQNQSIGRNAVSLVRGCPRWVGQKPTSQSDSTLVRFILRSRHRRSSSERSACGAFNYEIAIISSS
jgi:hypothetical protein